MIQKWIANNFPSLGKYKRYITAYRDGLMPVKETYSQHQEDKFFLTTLTKYNLNGSLYVDIGANHPTDISNTYLLYRNGMNGIVIEPNAELISLFHKFRKKDTTLAIGCSNVASILKFNISKTPVISSFSSSRDVNVYKSIYVPVLPLDSALNTFQFSYINLLSIDVEGLTTQVLQGAASTLKRTLLICLESDSVDEKKEHEAILGDTFVLVAEFGCNAIYMNKYISSLHKITV